MQFLKFKIFEDNVLHAISTRDGGVRKVVKLLGKWKEASKRPERCK